MDIPLSLTTMIRLLFISPARSSPSSASPPDREPSPIMATTLWCSPLASRAFAKPQARLTEVEVWPSVKGSWALSWGALYPVISSYRAGSKKP